MEILSVVIFVLFVLTVLGLSWYFARRSKSASGYFAAGGIMAANPKWCLSISEWKKHFADWILDASPESILKVNVFFLIFIVRMEIKRSPVSCKCICWNFANVLSKISVYQTKLSYDFLGGAGY